MGEREKWELKLLGVTIIGMILSALLSGLFVYILIETSPAIVSIAPIKFNASTEMAKMSISNFGDNPARNVRVLYEILELEEKSKQSAIAIPVLFNKEEFFYINFNALKGSILYAVEKEMEVSFMTNPKRKYSLLLEAYCDSCKIYYPNYPIVISPSFYCSKFNTEVNCEIRGWSLGGIS